MNEIKNLGNISIDVKKSYYFYIFFLYRVLNNLISDEQEKDINS